jgi:methyl-accepting chemotaxis protein
MNAGKKVLVYAACFLGFFALGVLSASLWAGRTIDGLRKSNRDLTTKLGETRDSLSYVTNSSRELGLRLSTASERLDIARKRSEELGIRIKQLEGILDRFTGNIDGIKSTANDIDGIVRESLEILRLLQEGGVR